MPCVLAVGAAIMSKDPWTLITCRAAESDKSSRARSRLKGVTNTFQKMLIRHFHITTHTGMVSFQR